MPANQRKLVATPRPLSFNPCEREQEYAKDVWRLKVVGIEPPPYVTKNSLSFKSIQPEWLRCLAKQFLRFQSATKAYYTLEQYLRSIGHFSKFLQQQHNPRPEDIDRRLMVEFIGYVHSLREVNEAKNKIITHIKLLTTVASWEGWENITKEKIMYRDDRLPIVRAQPRYIPMDVLQQLNRHIIELPADIQRFVLLLQHTGRRVGEICALSLDCLLQDGEGDYFLRYYEFKMKKEETIPISHEIAALIAEQRSWIQTKFESALSLQYLFTAKDLRPICPPTIRQELNSLAKRHAIKGPDGQLWRFQPHQFRHTVGTTMINAGVPAHIVQRYLKHSSPEMTMRYAYLHDSTLKAEFAKFQGKLVDVTGRIIISDAATDVPTDLKWLKRNILAQALPNGYCGLPIQQGSCPHANACLGCSHFRTSAQFLPNHKQQLAETDRLLTTAEQNGWSRQIEMNKQVKQNLESIIESLETN